mmetsp:Transcript_62677/g.149521  ORF Transcript_62677/g.149521 Transcript_62677/m.149521 type:complete len:275 (+) Transcript_62677:89-913(+)
MSAREVMINAAAPPPVVEAPVQVGMQVGGNIVTGPAMQAYAILNSQRRCQLRQQRQWIEALTGFERNNRYVMRDESGRDLFFVQEGSTCLERNCCKGECKAWRMDVYLLGPGGVDAGLQSMTPFMHLERPCTLTCFCLNRPEVEVSELPSGRVLGYIEEPFTCCNLTFTVHDTNRNPLLKTDISLCNWGLCCPCPCEGLPCQTVEFPITDFENGQEVAKIRKHWMFGDICQCLGEWDNYWMEFGAVNNPDFKVLITGLALFVQMRFFDSRNQQQ